MDKYNLCRASKRKILEETVNTKAVEKHIQNICNRHLVPESMLADILTMRTDISDYDDFIVFCIAEELLDNKVIETYCKPNELAKLKKQKYEKPNIKSVKWHMLQIAPDQWIGAVSVKQLMELRDAQMLNYNPNTQRPMRIKTVNGEVVTQIALNRNAVNKIKDAFLSSSFISNVITLNIQEGSDFDYDQEMEELEIENMDHLDMLDGYHRYIAMSDIYNSNPDFDYPMVLQIVAFTEAKAKQFIYQEDQKTKMRRIDSDSFNQNSYANQIISELNREPIPLKGLFDKGSIIDFAYAATSLDRIYEFNTKKYQRSKILEIKNKLASGLRNLVNSHPELLDVKWNAKRTLITLCVIAFDMDINNIEPLLNKLSQDRRFLLNNRIMPRDVAALREEA